MNPRTDEVEDVDLFASTIERALGSYPIERLFLNPDCGFGTFANRPMNSGEIAMAKIANMAEAARCVRERQAPAISRPWRRDLGFFVRDADTRRATGQGGRACRERVRRRGFVAKTAGP